MARFPTTRTLAMCLPFWYPGLQVWEGKHLLKIGAVTDCNPESKTFGIIPMDPERMRKVTETQLWELNLPVWPQGKPLPMTIYAAARHVSSEADTIGEKMGVALGAKKRAALRAKAYKRPDYGVDDLLLTAEIRQPGGEWKAIRSFGPINATCGAEVIRWAATSKDPGIVDILIAELAHSGRIDDWARGTDDQIGPLAMNALYGPNAAANVIKRKALESNAYWVGPLPGVRHRKTMFFTTIKGLDSSSAEGRELVAAALAAVANPASDEDYLPTCVRADTSTRTVVTVAAVALTGAVAIALFATKTIKPPRRMARFARRWA